MPDSNTMLLIVLSAIVVLAVLFVVFSSKQQKKLQELQNDWPRLQEKSEEIVLEYTEQALRDMEYRLSSGYAQDMLALQGLLHNVQQSGTARTEALGQRIDSAMQGQEGRIRHLSDVLGERLSGNDEKVERMRETLFQGLSGMRQENAAKLAELNDRIVHK